jgi:hypothetical protein
MNYQEKIKVLVDEFNNNASMIENLKSKNIKIMGQIELLQELIKTTPVITTEGV